MATGNVILDEPRPIEVLHEGRWRPGVLEAYRRDRNGWRGLVRYRDDLAHYFHWRGEAELRRQALVRPSDWSSSLSDRLIETG